MGDIKKSKNKTGATIKNYMTDIRNAETIAAKEKTKLRCKCPHTDENGKALLFRSDNKKSDFTGNPLFVCRLCGAYLDIGELTEEDLASAIDKVSCAAEIVHRFQNFHAQRIHHALFHTHSLRFSDCLSFLYIVTPIQIAYH